MWTFAPESQRIDTSVSLLVDLLMHTTHLSPETPFIIMNAVGLPLPPLLLPFCEGGGNARVGLIPAVV